MKEQKSKDPAVSQPEFTNQTDKGFTNIKNIPGDSVEEHSNIEFANTIISGNEIKQQNENQ